MAIKVRCTCGQAVRVQNEAGGKYINCPACKEAVLVPAPSLDRAEERLRKAAHPSWDDVEAPARAVWPWVAGILVVMLLGGFGVTALIIQASKPTAKPDRSNDELADSFDDVTPPARKAAREPGPITNPLALAEPPKQNNPPKKNEPATKKGPFKNEPASEKERTAKRDFPRGKEETPATDVPVKEAPRKIKVGQFSEEEYDRALRFFTKHNASGTLRLGPGWGLEHGGQWTVLVLISRTMIGKPVTAALGDATIYADARNPNIDFTAGKQVRALFNTDPETQVEFLRRYAGAIDKGEAAALLVKTAPLFGNKVPLNGAAKLTGAALLSLLQKAKKPEDEMPKENGPAKKERGKKDPEKNDGGDVYYYTAPANLRPSDNVEIYEAPNGKIRANVLRPGSLEVDAVNGVKYVKGRLVGRPRPDGLGSTRIKILVKDSPGYTTFAGLKFLDRTTAAIGMDGTIEVSKAGVHARDELGNRYISKKVMHNGSRKILMVEGRKSAPRPEQPAETDAAKKEKLADTKLTFAEALRKSGKIAKARERYQEIVDKFPETDASKKAKAALEKLRKKAEEANKQKD